MPAEGDGDFFVQFLDLGIGILVGGFLELLLAEFEFAFLDGGHAFAGGDVAETAEHRADFGEGVHVFVHGGTGKGELEREFFEGADGAGGEVGLAIGGELEDLARGFLRLGFIVEEFGGGGAAHEALESGFVDLLVEFLGGALSGFAVAKGFDEYAELLELTGVEVFEAIDVGLHIN